MKIYDCFVFFNELKLLEFRLSMYYDYVDYFVLCECSKTQRGDDKPYYFEENKALFEKYADKIIHVKADNPPVSKGSDDWSIEFYQRNQIAQGLKDAQNEDLITISDLDEFYSPGILTAIKENKRLPISLNLFSEGKKKMPLKTLKMIKNGTLAKILCPNLWKSDMPYWCGQNAIQMEGILDKTPISIQQDFFYYFMNYRWKNSYWHGSIFCLYKNFKSAQNLRNGRKYLPFIKRRKSPIAWHFSYLGGKEQIKKKLASIIEGDKASIVGDADDVIDDCIKNGKSLYAWQNHGGKKLELISPQKIGLTNIEQIIDKYPEWFYLHNEQEN